MRRFVVAVLFAAACGNRALSVPPPVCTWPAQYDAASTASSACVAGRYYLDCTDEGTNLGEACLSADKDACPQHVIETGVPECTSACQDDEYALACATGPTGATPPSSCRFLTGSPGGYSIVCCPCGT